MELMHGRHAPRGIVLDVDSSVPTHDEQKMSVRNGDYACDCYHSLFVFNQFGDLEHCAPRSGNVHSTDGWNGVLNPVVAPSHQGKVSRIYFRSDAAFAMPADHEFLQAEWIKYAIRLPANQILQHRIGYLFKRPVERPSNEVRRFHANFTYQAGSWSKPRPGDRQSRMASQRTLSARRVHRHQPVAPGRQVVALYNKRGTCEQGKGAISWTRLSCRTFAASCLKGWAAKPTILAARRRPLRP
jgi:Transposase DDE domain group 1